ncbi:hypothetical protein IP86_16215 [Rhodopseudomonas sp. AAP120]|nr:hypothetical protein IP86_16215 [Rhodopseudomonas sp. AAP120]
MLVGMAVGVAMIVTAVLIVHVVIMTMGMIMARMLMRVTVIIMPVMSVIVVVMVIVAMMAVIVMAVRAAVVRRRIGTAFRIEWRIDLKDLATKPLHHIGDDVIAADAERLGHDLGRQMPVAEMPGQSHQMQRIATADLQQRLRRGNHFDQPAIVEHQRVAAAQRNGVF